MDTVTHANWDSKKISYQARPTSQEGSQEEIMVGSSSEAKKSISGIGCSAKAHGEARGSSASASTTRTKLNPLAREWSLAKNRAPQEERCLFVTFSKGYPLNEHEITWFFNQKFGRCVERVFVFRPQRYNPPVCAKVVFRFSCIPVAVLGKENRAHFRVNAKPMWCKRYVSRKNQNQEKV